MFRNISEIKAANTAIGNYWFTKDTLSFFNSVVYPKVYDGQYFLTSEQGPDMDRAWSIRVAHADGSIDTVGDFQSHATMADAVSAVEALVATVAKVKAEIHDMLATGWESSEGVTITAEAITSFGDLHDYCDANCLGGMCDEGVEESFPSNDAWMEHCNVVSDVVDQWIKAGGLRDALLVK